MKKKFYKIGDYEFSYRFFKPTFERQRKVVIRLLEREQRRIDNEIVKEKFKLGFMKIKGYFFLFHVKCELKRMQKQQIERERAFFHKEEKHFPNER